jgi:hypothetical protein
MNEADNRCRGGTASQSAGGSGNGKPLTQPSNGKSGNGFDAQWLCFVSAPCEAFGKYG